MGVVTQFSFTCFFENKIGFILDMTVWKCGIEGILAVFHFHPSRIALKTCHIDGIYIWDPVNQDVYLGWG